MDFVEINKLGKEQFPHLFEPIIIRNQQIPNRIHFSPMGLNLAHKDGTISEKLDKFYVTLAQNGVGMVIFQNASVSPYSFLYDNTLQMHNEIHAKSIQKTVNRIKGIGAVPSIQLNHYGRQGTTVRSGKPVLAPSNIPSTNAVKHDPNYSIRVMTKEDIEQVKMQFIHAAELCKYAGFDCIQLHCSGGQLINQFLSKKTNKRQDEYGGDLQNRAKFLIEIIKGIRKAIGENIVLSLRIVLDEFYPDEEGIKPNDYKSFTPLLEEAGADIFMGHWTTYDTWKNGFIGDPEAKKKIFHEQMKTLKCFTKYHVGFTGFINSLAEGEALISNGITEFIGMARSLFVDNELIVKTLIKQEDEIYRCKNCLLCFGKQKLGDEQNEIYCVNRKID